MSQLQYSVHKCGEVQQLKFGFRNGIVVPPQGVYSADGGRDFTTAKKTKVVQKYEANLKLLQAEIRKLQQKKYKTAADRKKID